MGMDERAKIAAAVALSFSVASCICSLLNLILIYIMGQWNGYLAILSSMAFFQLIYDATFYLSRGTNFNHTWTAVFGFFQAVGGLSVTFWTNILSGVVLYVVVCKSRFDILQYLWSLSALVYVPTLVISVVEISCTVAGENYCETVLTDIYYWIRIASIAMNFFIFGYIIYFIRTIRSKNKNPSNAEISIVVLSRRMMYYPIIQFFSRIFNACYEEIYGFTSYDGENNHGLQSKQQFIFQLLASITQPSAGIGFFVVFLIFQPQAKEYLYSLLACRSKAMLKSNGSLQSSIIGGTSVSEKSAERMDRGLTSVMNILNPNSQFETENPDLSFAITSYDVKKYENMGENELLAIIEQESLFRSSQPQHDHQQDAYL